jgi:hypothetical protein
MKEYPALKKLAFTLLLVVGIIGLGYVLISEKKKDLDKPTTTLAVAGPKAGDTVLTTVVLGMPPSNNQWVTTNINKVYFDSTTYARDKGDTTKFVIIPSLDSFYYVQVGPDSFPQQTRTARLPKGYVIFDFHQNHPRK